MNASSPVSIQLILNTKNRLDEVKPLFEWLASKGHGKLTKDHFVIDTVATISPRDNKEATFAALQNEAFQAGFKYNCYCFNIVA